MISVSLAASPWVIRTKAARPLTSTAAPFASTAIKSSPFVAATVTVSALPVGGRATERAGEIDVDARDVCPAHVVHRNRVSPAEGPHVDPLDVIKVHDDVAEVSGE